MIANASTTVSIGPAISIATGNSLEALVGAAVINVWSNGRNTFSTPNTVAKFAVICVVLPTPISATVGITTLAIAGYAEWANFANIWLTWWSGDQFLGYRRPKEKLGLRGIEWANLGSEGVRK